jgi:hypothetical protein
LAEEEETAPLACSLMEALEAVGIMQEAVVLAVLAQVTVA